MRHTRPVQCTFLFAALALAVAFGQEEGAIQLPPGTYPGQLSESRIGDLLGRLPRMGTPPDANSTPVLPMWSYTVKSSRNNTTYTGKIVGANPSANTSVSISVVIIPVILNFKYSSTTSYVFNPTTTDPGCLGTHTALALTQQSPLFNNYNFAMGSTSVGNTQYADAFTRANFWTYAKGTNYHTLLGVTTAPAQTVVLTASNSSTANATVFMFSGQCGTNTGNTNLPGSLGVVNISTWDSIAQGLIHSLGLNASQFPLFIFYNAVMSQGYSSNLNDCCILGYHNALGSGQTYGVAEFEGRNQTLFGGIADVAAMSHEVNEWTQDPLGTNPTPAWGNIGQVSGCQGNYEVGDPLSGKLLPLTVMSNGFSYHLQELAFYSWFYGGPSLGVNGWYSDHGTLTKPASACPPGGA